MIEEKTIYEIIGSLDIEDVANTILAIHANIMTQQDSIDNSLRAKGVKEFVEYTKARYEMEKEIVIQELKKKCKSSILENQTKKMNNILSTLTLLSKLMNSTKGE